MFTVFSYYWLQILLFSFIRHAIEAVDRSLCDTQSVNQPFGGTTIVFGGNFQQTLPIVIKGSCKDIILATLQRSVL
jgi:hypothetical protein